MRTTAIILLGCLSLAGCGDRHLDDVRKFVKDSDKLPPGRIPPLPEVKPYEAFSYDAYDLVDPFKPRKIVPPKAVAGAGGIQPDFNRRKEPLEAYPDVPTLKSAIGSDWTMGAWRGIAGPKGMDPKVVKKLADTFKKAMADPEHVKKMEDVGLAVKVMTGDEYKKYYDDLHVKAIKYTDWAKKAEKK